MASSIIETITLFAVSLVMHFTIVQTFGNANLRGCCGLLPNELLVKTNTTLLDRLNSFAFKLVFSMQTK